MQRYEATAGYSIDYAAKAMVALAKQTNDQVQTDFNGILITANPSDKPEALVEFYSTESQRRYEAHTKSPEYKKQQREAAESQRRKEDRLAAALAVAPKEMSLRDAEGWQKAVEANPDAYGGAVMDYAQRWARLMEWRIANGETVADCAEDMSHLADNDGITGLMYGCAVSILSHVWKHGDDLRRFNQAAK